MKVIIVSAALLAPGLLFAQSHEEHQHSAVMPAQNMSQAGTDPAMQEAHAMSQAAHGGSINWLLMADRFEYLEDSGDERLQWEAQSWIGGDLNKFWFKTEGTYERDAASEVDAEVQLLYSRAFAPFWDLQTGLRHDEGAYASADYAVLGINGLAPYWFEVDAAAFLSDSGKVSTRLEVEYELRFSQRLILQPRLELNYAFADDPDLNSWQGMQEASFSLRLRYEFLREFAPYVGVEWSRAYGKTGTVLQRSGLDDREASVVAGLRVWY